VGEKNKAARAGAKARQAARFLYMVFLDMASGE